MSAPAAAISRPSLLAVLELLKPITWFAPIWAFGCGAVSAGHMSAHWPLAIAGMVLAGPFVCATSQAVNDWYDRDVDAINQPERPIPSGRIPGQWGFFIAVSWSGLSLLWGFALGRFALAATIFGLALAWAYSAPPLRLKRNGWWGNAAVALCYEGLPWFTGAAVLGGAMPASPVLLAALLYSIGAHGIMTLNDFKSVEGDRATGIFSLPVRLGVDRAARLACVIMGLAQLAVVALLVQWGAWQSAGAIIVLVLVQAVLMRRLLKDPRAYAPWYNGTGTTLYVIGMLVTAFALRPEI